MRPRKALKDLLAANSRLYKVHLLKKAPLGYIEGTNLKARNIIRKAAGLTDKEYMKLKIIQGCSTIGVFRPYPYPMHHNPG